MDVTDDTLVAEEGTIDAESGGTAGRRRHDGFLERGAEVGRYSILNRLGAGGMGVVYAAYDPQLDRKVAIKLLIADGYGSTGTQAPAQQRLLREARALARLAHPNVVTVHDVGIHEGAVFVAMEFVDGQTLTQWLAADPRPRRERVTDVFLRAGRGLAAAHDVGLVHRDFKPDNVMIGTDGRVRVMDFGLAHEDGAASEATSKEDVAESSNPRLTRTGAVMGTPRYMAPEQHRGEDVDGRTDQFAYCVALHEALYGVRPFAGETLPELTLSVTKGKIVDPPADAQVPSWIRRIVLKGLSLDASERFKDMRALLRALEDDPARRRNRWLGVGTIAFLVAGSFGALAMRGSAGASCDGAASLIGDHWNDERRGEIERAFADTAHPEASEAASFVAQGLDGYAEAWSTMRRDACEANQRQEESDLMLERRYACLDRRLEVFVGMLEVLESADPAIVEMVQRRTGRLPPLDRCADLEALRAAVAPPEDPALAAEVADIRARLGRVTALEIAGRYDQGLSEGTSLAAEAAQLQYPPVQVEVLYRIGTLRDRAGEYDASEDDLEAAYFGALGVSHLDVAADAAIKLVHVAADELERDRDGLQWAKHARAVLDQAGGRALRRRGWLANNEGNVYLRLDDPQAALASFEAAQRDLGEALDPEDAGLAVVLDNLARTQLALGEVDAALEGHGAALALREKVLGKDHPHVAGTLLFQADALARAGRRAEAIEAAQRAVNIKERTLGEDHPEVARAREKLERLRGDP